MSQERAAFLLSLERQGCFLNSEHLLPEGATFSRWEFPLQDSIGSSLKARLVSGASSYSPQSQELALHSTRVLGSVQACIERVGTWIDKSLWERAVVFSSASSAGNTVCYCNCSNLYNMIGECKKYCFWRCLLKRKEETFRIPIFSVLTILFPQHSWPRLAQKTCRNWILKVTE